MKVSKELKALLTQCITKKHGNSNLLSCMLRVEADGTVYLCNQFMDVPVYKVDSSLLGLPGKLSVGNHYVLNNVNISNLCSDLENADESELLSLSKEHNWDPTGRQEPLTEEELQRLLSYDITLSVKELDSLLPFREDELGIEIRPDLGHILLGHGMVMTSDGHFAKSFEVFSIDGKPQHKEDFDKTAFDSRIVLACQVAGCDSLKLTGGYKIVRRELVDRRRWVSGAGDANYEDVTYIHHIFSGGSPEGNPVTIHTIKTERNYTDVIDNYYRLTAHSQSLHKDSRVELNLSMLDDIFYPDKGIDNTGKNCTDHTHEFWGNPTNTVDTASNTRTHSTTPELLYAVKIVMDNQGTMIGREVQNKTSESSLYPRYQTDHSKELGVVKGNQSQFWWAAQIKLLKKIIEDLTANQEHSPSHTPPYTVHVLERETNKPAIFTQGKCKYLLMPVVWHWKPVDILRDE